MTLPCNADKLQPLVMASAGRPEMKGFYARDAAERRRLRDVLCDQLSRDLLRLLNDEIQTDFILNVGQTKFKIHKAVLLARAPTFYELVTRQETEEAFTVQNVESSEIQAFLKIVYASLWSVKETEDHVVQMMAVQSCPDHNDEKCSDLQSTTVSAIENTGSICNNKSLALDECPKESYNCGDLSDCDPPSDLGMDLRSLYKHSCCADVTIQIEDQYFHVHRAILCARSSYFAAMLSGCWAETSRELIKIQGLKPADMEVLMHFIYGGIMELPKSTDPGQVLSIADMYGLEGLREVAVYVLKRDYCKFFLKPVVGMQQSVLECLSIAYSLGEEPLYTSCMRWIEKYFVKCWSERSFANLPEDLQKSCFTILVQSLSYRNAAFLLMESDRLISSLPGVKWAEKARSLASDLQAECVRFMVTNFSQIIRSESFANLLQAQGMSSRPYLLEHVFNEIEKSISFQNCSFLFMALDELLNLASKNEMVFTCQIQALRDKLWSFLVQSFYAVRHTEGWKLMRPSDQSRIQAVAFDKGDDRRLAKKPVFTSSQQNRSKIVKSGETATSESKRHSDTYLPNRRKMKSDSLGASGQTTNVSRTASAKGKDDDVKGKDVKKVAVKGSKDPKPTEKTTTAKPKIIVKTKPENNDNTKTESCASKCDTASTSRTVPAGKMGTRPKTSNGSSNPPAKVKTLKKVCKDPASPVKGSVPSMKFTNCNGELSNSSLSSGEQNHEHASADQPNSATSSPHNVTKTLKNSLEVSKELGMGAKSKSTTTKISNESSVKRKVNGAECREVSSSSTKKMSAEGGNDSILQKKKGTKIITANCTALRPKSAPAALTKKQAVPGDGLNLPKSVTSKQAEVKSDTKLVNQSTSADKNGPLNKKTTKTTLASTSKTQSNLQNNKCNGSKSSITNHRESKPKVQINSKTSSLNHRSSQKVSPSAVKNGHQPAVCLGKNLPKSDGSEVPVSLINEDKQADSCQFEEGADHNEGMAVTADASDRCISMCNQESMLQKPNLEHNHCQENNSTASVLLYISNSKEDLTEETNQTKAINADNTGSHEVHFMSLSNEQKPDCKIICDSENSKCADSSSESELCSVKEVERAPKSKEETMTFMEISENTGKNMHSSTNAAESCLQGVSASRQHALNNVGPLMNCASERQIPDYPSDMNITEVIDSHRNYDMKFMGQWSKHSSMLHERESPESESGSASTSSDDIKPRSEDYDAGGSQDDDGSNERGISKCSTMRCHDFLGRSSSDTSTPEELKGYDGSLRIDVKLKKDSSELFRVNSTSDDEGPRKRTEPWQQSDLSRHSAAHTAVCSNVQLSQEIEHLSSSADETEDERSEAENALAKDSPEVAAQPYQGIINLAFDDIADLENEGQRAPDNANFMRSVLLSVDECEELGSDEGDHHTSQVRKAESLTPSDVFEKNNVDGSSALCSGCSQNTEGKPLEKTTEYTSLDAVQLTLEGNSMTVQEVAEAGACKGSNKPTEPEGELKSQARPCHLDLYTEVPCDTQRFCCTKTAKACKSQFLDYQGRDNHAPSTESSNTALPAGHIDDIDSLAQSCMFDHRPPKSLSPIYEMDPGEGIEQRLKTEPRLMDFEFEDQQFVERDWTLLRQLLADHGSDADIINSVPEDLSLAQYLINQTLLLARDNSKSQGKAWGDLSSPFEDSTSVTVTSFSPDECSSPHGEWTILELETHH
ncbi:BTB/POZ domain-containing protein 8 isoform X2 [Pseudophryne corroboree]|uniref:BTB/POZ domain-containing protein 8 isoform X2 n=1 Tax=Pseudophryne corroboree TaxID=495146 RepID=UPI003081E93E